MTPRDPAPLRRYRVTVRYNTGAVADEVVDAYDARDAVAQVTIGARPHEIIGVAVVPAPSDAALRGTP